MPIIIDSTGTERYLGNLLPEGRDLQLFGTWNIFGAGPDSKTPILARSQWDGSRKLPHYAPKRKFIRNQLKTNMCNPFAIIAAMEALRRRSGFIETALSPAYIYAAVNNGVDQGSPLEPAMMRAMSAGAPPAVNLPEFQFDPRKWPTGIDAIASEYRVLEAWVSPNFEYIMSSVHYDFQTIIGVYWGVEDRLDSDGWLAEEPMGGIAGGHAILAWLPVVRETARGLQWGILCQNSWGPEWGMDGWFVIPEGRFRRSPFAGAWTPRSIMATTADLSKIPTPIFPTAV